MWKIQASSKFASSGNMIRDRTAYLHALQAICCVLCRKESETYLYFFWGGKTTESFFFFIIFFIMELNLSIHFQSSDRYYCSEIIR